MIKLILSLLLFSHSSFATIWITFADPDSGKIAAIGASSGPIGDSRTMIIVDNRGIAVVGAYALGRRNGELYRLLSDESLSARELAVAFSERISDRWYNRRISLVTSRFEVSSLAGKGCHSNNHYCGEIEDQYFTVTGGGLESEGVLLAARVALSDPLISDLPVECRLYSAMNAIFREGGEKLSFNRLAYVIDDVTKDDDIKQNVFFRRGKEENLLRKFKEDLASSEINCEL